MQKYKRNNNFVSFNRIAREEQRHRIEWAEKKKKDQKSKNRLLWQQNEKK